MAGRTKSRDKTSSKSAKPGKRVKNGASFVVKCTGVYGEGDLLLVVTATREQQKD